MNRLSSPTICEFMSPCRGSKHRTYCESLEDEEQWKCVAHFKNNLFHGMVNYAFFEQWLKYQNAVSM